MFLPLVTICLLNPMDQSVNCKHFEPQEIAESKEICDNMIISFISSTTPTLRFPYTITSKCRDLSINL